MPLSDEDFAIAECIVTRVEPKAGDLLVLRFKRPITSDAAARVGSAFREAMKRAGHERVALFILDDGASFQVVRLPAADPSERAA